LNVSELLLPLRKDLDTVHAAVAALLKKTGRVQYSEYLENDPLEFCLRPALVMTSAYLCGRPPAGVIYVAEAVQLIFLAEFVHGKAAEEDVQSGDLKAYVLAGDYLFSGSFRALADAGLKHLLGPLARAVCARCEAAVENFKGPEYPSGLIRKETALLIGECCRLPAMMAGADFEAQLFDFGINFGMAYGYLKRESPSLKTETYIEAARNVLSVLPAGQARRQLHQFLDYLNRETPAEVAASR
jgi:geranylgeranyl pyrophosphate synthase